MKLNKRVTVRLSQEHLDFLGEPMSDNLRATIEFVMSLRKVSDKVQPQQEQLTEADIINKFIPETPEDKTSGALEWS